MRSLRLVEEPDLAGVVGEAEAAAEVAAYAGAVEDVLLKEQAQWGQLRAACDSSGDWPRLRALGMNCPRLRGGAGLAPAAGLIRSSSAFVA
jgi:hypothetical protein